MGRVPTFDECTARLRQRRGQRPQRRVLIADRHIGKANGKNFAKVGSNGVVDRSRPERRMADVRTRSEWSQCFFARQHPSSADVDAPASLENSPQRFERRIVQPEHPNAPAATRTNRSIQRVRRVSAGDQSRILRPAATPPLFRRTIPKPKLPFGPALQHVATLPELPARKQTSPCSLERPFAKACRPRTDRRTRRADRRRSDRPIRRLQHTSTTVPDRSRENRTGLTGPGNQFAGLVVLQFGNPFQAPGVAACFRFQVHRLAESHSGRACGMGERPGKRDSGLGIRAGSFVAKNLERQSLQRASRQHCGRFVPLHMDRRHPPANVVVIHARQVVMDD